MLLSFKNRLERILDGRKLTPWGKSLGISNGVITAMGKGETPGPDFLRAIALIENANLTYLLTGEGAPFVVQDAPPATLSGQIYYLSDGGLRAIVLVNTAEYTYDRSGKTVTYQSVRIYRGNQHTSQAPAGNHYKFSAIAELLAGHISNHQLLGDNGLLALAKPTIEPWFVSVALDHDASLMRHILQLISEQERQQQLQLNDDQRARVASTAYTHALCNGLDENDLQDYLVPLVQVIG